MPMTPNEQIEHVAKAIFSELARKDSWDEMVAEANDNHEHAMVRQAKFMRAARKAIRAMEEAVQESADHHLTPEEMAELSAALKKGVDADFGEERPVEKRTRGPWPTN